MLNDARGTKKYVGGVGGVGVENIFLFSFFQMRKCIGWEGKMVIFVSFEWWGCQEGCYGLPRSMLRKTLQDNGIVKKI